MESFIRGILTFTRWWKWVFCAHDWKQIDKEMRAPDNHSFSAERIDRETLLKLKKGTVVWLFQCSKCRRVKTISEMI